MEWKAFPITAPATPEQIDRDRFRFQDEYVEWSVATRNDSLAQLTFTTEFIEYFEALAQTDVTAIRKEIANLYSGAAPTDEELFGPGFDPAIATPMARADRIPSNLTRNRWNNGERGILCLTQEFNTMGALFNLVGQCGVSKPTMNAGDVCANVDGFCGPNRNSDPRVCLAAQTLVRASQSFCLEDPCGIRIRRLDGSGLWKVDGVTVDINDETANKGVWKRFGTGGVDSFRSTRMLHLLAHQSALARNYRACWLSERSAPRGGCGVAAVVARRARKS